MLGVEWLLGVPSDVLEAPRVLFFSFTLARGLATSTLFNSSECSLFDVEFCGMSGSVLIFKMNPEGRVPTMLLFFPR